MSVLSHHDANFDNQQVSTDNQIRKTMGIENLQQVGLFQYKQADGSEAKFDLENRIQIQNVQKCFSRRTKRRGLLYFRQKSTREMEGIRHCLKGIFNFVFDSALKGYIYSLDGQSKMQIPKDDLKESLGLIQPFLVLQIYIPLGKNLHIEVGVTDATKTKRRLIFHNGAFKDTIVSNPLHARIPIAAFRRNQWMNLSLDISAFAHHCFKGVVLRSIDLIVVTASCKLRKIFTMKNPLMDDQANDDEELNVLLQGLAIEEQRDNLPYEQVPGTMEFPLRGIVSFNQFIFPQRILRQTDENVNAMNGEQLPGAVIAGERKADKNAPVQLAFGQRYAGQLPPPVKNQIIPQKQAKPVGATAMAKAKLASQQIGKAQTLAETKRGAQSSINEDINGECCVRSSHILCPGKIVTKTMGVFSRCASGFSHMAYKYNGSGKPNFLYLFQCQ